MPTLSHLGGPFACPVCGTESALGDASIAFRWGGMPAGFIPGQRVHWWHEPDGRLLEPYVYAAEVTNYGDPGVRDIVVLQDLFLGWDHRCLRCDAPFERVGVEIRDGLFIAGLLWTREVAMAHRAVEVGADYFRVVGETLVRDTSFDDPRTSVSSERRGLKLGVGS